MFKRTRDVTGTKSRVNKVVAGFAALATTTVIGTAGIAGATAPVNQSGSTYAGGAVTNTVNNISLTLSNIRDSTVNIVVNIAK